MKFRIACLFVVIVIAACGPASSGDFEDVYDVFDGTVPVTYSIEIRVGDSHIPVFTKIVTADHAIGYTREYETGARESYAYIADDCAWRVSDVDWAVLEAAEKQLNVQLQDLNRVFEEIGLPELEAQYSNTWEQQDTWEGNKDCPYDPFRTLYVHVTDDVSVSDTIQSHISFLNGVMYIEYKSADGGLMTMKVPAEGLIGLIEEALRSDVVDVEKLSVIPDARLDTTYDANRIMRSETKWLEIATFSFPQMDLKARDFFISRFNQALPYISTGTQFNKLVWSAHLQSGQEAYGRFDSDSSGSISGSSLLGFGYIEGAFQESQNGEFAVKLQEIERGSIYLAP